MPPRGLRALLRMVRHAGESLRVRPASRFSIADVLEARARERADHPAILFEERQVSYRQLNELANQVAHWARSHGIGCGDVVALLIHNRPEYLAVWLGLAKIGASSALLNHNLGGPGLAHALREADAQRLILGSECLSLLESLEPELRQGLDAFVWRDPDAPEASALPEDAPDMVPELEKQARGNPERLLRAEVRAGDSLLYIYTSGTTGLPKAARMSHLRVNWLAMPGLISGFGADDVMYCALPLYHTAGGGMAVMAALRSGGTLALARRFSARGFWEDVRRHRVTAFQYIGEMCRYLLSQPPNERDREHRVSFCIGNGLRPDIWEAFQERFAIPRIIEFYGATEGNVAMANFSGRVGSVGRPPPVFTPKPRLIRYDVETDTHPRDPDGRYIECGPNEVGEAIGRIPSSPRAGTGRFEGYTSREATERKILRDVFRKGDLWFRTGDLLRCDEDGYFYFVDRIGDTFRWKGENVSTQEVAEALAIDPSVETCSVYGVECGPDGKIGMAALVLAPGAELDGAALYERAREALAAYAVPGFLRVCPQADVTSTFKLRKVDLQREGYDPEQCSDPLFVRDDTVRAYVPLTPERLAALRSGELRL